MVELFQILENFKKPEYVHVLINHLPFSGMLISIVLLVLGVLIKSRDVKVIALTLIVAFGIATRVVVRFGEKGFNTVLASSNEEAKTWLVIHKDRAEKVEYIFYATSMIALITLFAVIKNKSFTKILILSTTVFATICVVTSAWVSHAGGQICHSEFRRSLSTVGYSQK